MSKTAIDKLVHEGNVAFSEARQERGRAQKLQKQVEEANARAEWLEGEARAFMAAADKLEGRG